MTSTHAVLRIEIGQCPTGHRLFQVHSGPITDENADAPMVADAWQVIPVSRVPRAHSCVLTGLSRAGYQARSRCRRRTKTAETSPSTNGDDAKLRATNTRSANALAVLQCRQTDTNAFHPAARKQTGH